MHKALAGIRLLAFDVDGVFTDGRFSLSDDGVESKAFHTQDGYGIRQILDAGIAVAVISGRRSVAVQQRMAELGVKYVFLGCGNKVDTFESLLTDLELSRSQCAYAGDDVPDMALLQIVGVSFAVANAHETIKAICDYTTTKSGGNGAVREICDLLLSALADEADRPK